MKRRSRVHAPSTMGNLKVKLFKTTNQVCPGNRISDISNAIFKIGNSNDYGIIESFSGHGIGKSLHE
ncbi:MAG: hypothetical protein Q8804_02530, partial [Pigeon pea little leaf phytoplasma]|nr:hypothetical protein [Pigeon pea little leaf phytoplasma]